VTGSFGVATFIVGAIAISVLVVVAGLGRVEGPLDRGEGAGLAEPAQHLELVLERTRRRPRRAGRGPAADGCSERVSWSSASLTTLTNPDGVKRTSPAASCRA